MENDRFETVFLNPETVELRFYESPEDRTYRSWKMNRSVAAAVADWWRNSGIHSLEAKKIKSDIVEITLLSASHAEIKALDSLGRPTMVGWSLPILGVKALETELSITHNADTSSVQKENQFEIKNDEKSNPVGFKTGEAGQGP